MRWGAEMKAAYLTLGCKVNQYDTEAMQEILESHGFKTVNFDEKADVYLINTCTVTNIADRKSRQMIHRAVKNNKDAAIIVCGCLAQRSPQEILDIEGVNAVIGTKNRASIYRVVIQALNGEAVDAVSDIASDNEFEKLRISKSGERTRGHIKICEGCNNFCSYCIIPYARGRVRSRSLEEIVDEAKRLSQNGVKEVVLTGIHIGSYGKDLVGVSLIDVMESVHNVKNIERIRLGSLEPSLLTEEFCARASNLNKLCPQFHVSLQSGSTSVLRRMNRKYTAEEFFQYITNLRRYFENPAITTDIISGFVGETQEEHEETLRFIEKVGFSKIHVFPYSEREGTKAASMPGSVPLNIRKARGAEIAKAADIMAAKFAQGFVGKELEVLFEQPSKEKPGLYEGLTDRHLTVVADGAANEMKRTLIIERKGAALYGRCID